ncbi:hypothetical protein CRENBAI_008478 [Crenichthys baileyi]|uniref:Uncharacterized protein n=1 Tax=Crenichthys baileyi TaxID=28760 RepID=A0AAV9SC79_9TELE
MKVQVGTFYYTITTAGTMSSRIIKVLYTIISHSHSCPGAHSQNRGCHTQAPPSPLTTISRQGGSSVLPKDTMTKMDREGVLTGVSENVTSKKQYSLIGLLFKTSIIA